VRRLPKAALLALLVLAIVLTAGGLVSRALAEQTQRGNLVSALDGSLSPIALPRDHLAAVAVRLEGRLRSTDGSLLPRVTALEIGLPGQGGLYTRGLPVCQPRRLRGTTTAEALSACRGALVGRGQLTAVVALRDQTPFKVHARLLAFNSRISRHRAVLLHTGATNPPSSSVLPLRVKAGTGRFGTMLVGNVSPALGPWPRLSGFAITLFRRFEDRGVRRSYLSASCPIPPGLTAGFFSLARVSYRLAGGGRIATSIARSCRAR
jgi:hypothetical protein